MFIAVFTVYLHLIASHKQNTISISIKMVSIDGLINGKIITKNFVRISMCAMCLTITCIYYVSVVVGWRCILHAYDKYNTTGEHSIGAQILRRPSMEFGMLQELMRAFRKLAFEKLVVNLMILYMPISYDIWIKIKFTYIKTIYHFLILMFT